MRYHSTANFMYFGKSIRTICSKLTDKAPRGNIAPGGSAEVKNEFFQIWQYYASIDCKFFVLSKKYKNHVLKTYRKHPQGSIAP